MAKAADDVDVQDPEQVIGPVLHMFTQLAQRDDACLVGALQSQLLALARHPAVELDLRLAAGSLALEPERLHARKR